MGLILVNLVLVLAVAGCGGSSGGEFSEKNLPGTWELDFKALANDIMGAKMGPNYFNETFRGLRLTAQLQPGGELVVIEGAGPSSAKKEGTWKVNNPGAHSLKVSLATSEAAEDVVVAFVDADRIEMPGPPKLFSNAPSKRVQFTRVK